MSEAQTILTVSIVTYHTKFDVLEDVLASLKASTVPLEIILVDNSQNDAYFQQLSQRMTAKCVRAPRNGGYGYGHNYAMAHFAAEAPYHLVLNPDVEIHPNCLETLIALMNASPEIGLAVPLIHNMDGSIQHLNKRDPNVLDLALRRFAPESIRNLPRMQERMALFVRKDIGYEMPSDVPYASGCFMLFRRSVFDTVGRFDERYFMYFEDADISRKAREISKVMFLPQGSITHAWQRGSHRNFKLMCHTLVSAWRYFHKWGTNWA